MSNLMEFIVTGKGVLKEYNGADEVIIVPNDVKVIGSHILDSSNGEQVRKVVLPEGVMEIKEWAFASSNIAEIILPSTLKKIGPNAFDGCENLKSITIPEGITVIPDSCFLASGIEEVILPESIEKIDNSAFMLCNKLRKINLPHLDTLKIGAQAFAWCEGLVDENGFLILQNRVFTYCKDGNERKKVIIPDGIKVIEEDAFDQYECFDIELPIICPVWPTSGTAKKNGYARSIINRDGSTISFRDKDGKIVAKIVLAIENETEPKKNGVILSIKCSKSGKFDFAGYDSYFALLSKVPNKISMAIARLQYPYELSKEMQRVYMSFLEKQGNATGNILIDTDNIDMLMLLGDRKVFNAATTKKLIDYAKSKDKVAIMAWLLEYNNNNFGKSAAKSKISLSAQKTTPSNKAKEIQEQLVATKKQDSKKKAIAPWKKPKAGAHLVPRYMGEETVVEFPLKVEGIAIKGIANTAGDTPDNYKAITSVILPEGYTYIGNKAFFGCENLETISLPSTVREIGTQAFAGCSKLKEIILHKEVSFVGKDVFAGSNINVVVIETEKKTKIPSHLFFGCHINNLVVYGGPFNSNGNVFDYTGAVTGTDYAENMYKGNFPENIYLNDDFSTLDLKGNGGGNVKHIHSLADFDETILLDMSIRDIITEEKKKNVNVVDNSSKVVEPVIVDSIDFKKSTFVILGFDVKENWAIADEITKRGGTVKGGVTATVNYLVVPNRDIVKDSQIKKALELQAKGKSIAIINLSEFQRHQRIYDEK